VAGVVAAALVVGTAATLWQASIAAAEGERARLAEEDRLAQQARDQEAIRQRDAALLAERRQNALERATEAAFSGDLDKARKAIVAAQKAGVGADQVYWLQGVVHFQRGKFDDAIKEFEASLELKKTAAALGMLVRTYLAVPNFERHDMLRAELRTIKPVTPEDYMCRGFALTFDASAQTIADLDKAIELRDCPLARAFRAFTLTFIALDAQDPKLHERALDDIREAKKRLPDIPVVQYTSCLVHLNAADFYAETRQLEKQEAALAAAKDDAQALANHPINAHVYAAVRYLETIGKEEDAIKLLEQASRREETKALVTSYAVALYRKHRVEEALKVLDDSRQPENRQAQALRIFLLAEVHGPDRAYQAFQELAARDPGILRLSVRVYQPLLFLGKRAEAAKLRPVDHPGYTEAPDGKLRLAEYIAGTISAEELLKPRVGTPTQLELCQAHFWIGLVRLSDGDRKGARESFEKCVATRWLPLGIKGLARAFLERMKRDPEWPTWILARKN
jgi:tetratricopeptide (TPR) repeat protein